MRSLKFRIWNNRYSEFIRPDYGLIDFVYPLDGRISAVANSGEPMEDWELEQYTGLKDKNGKEIYEGDILKFRGRAYEVKFDNYGQFYMENRNYHWLQNGYSFRSVDIWCAEGILVEVVGNIHSNPELLEQDNARN